MRRPPRQHPLRNWMRASMWVLPVASMALALLVAPLVRGLEARTRWTLLGFGPGGAQALLGALASSLLAFIVFAFSMLLLAVQIAGGQLTSRIIARVFERRLPRWALGLFVFSFCFTLSVLGRVEDHVPQLSVMMAVLLTVGCITLFILLIQSVTLELRPISVLTAVSRDTREVIEQLFPDRFVSEDRPAARPRPEAEGVHRTLVHQGRFGVLRSVDREELVNIAARAGCVIELRPAIGDFIAPDDTLAHLYGDGAAAVDEARFRRCFELGVERTIYQDPGFGIRIIVDIAIRALSPAINDPTTAVLALDDLEHLLRVLGQRQLWDGITRDDGGGARLLERTPSFDDLFTLAVTEIRIYGAANPQVCRRLSAMLARLIAELPPERATVARRERATLLRAIESVVKDAELLALFAVPDRQGLGAPVEH